LGERSLMADETTQISQLILVIGLACHAMPSHCDCPQERPHKTSINEPPFSGPLLSAVRKRATASSTARVTCIGKRLTLATVR